jgi:uncharacterized protein (TIGR02271 family)
MDSIRKSGGRSQEHPDHVEHPDKVRVPIIEEHLQVGVRKEELGKVRAVKQVHEEDLIVSGPVYSEDIQIDRVPLNQYVETAPQVRHEGNTTIIPVVKEEVVVQTRLVLVEEVRITRRQVETMIEKPVTLRKEEIKIERSSGEGYSAEK